MVYNYSKESGDIDEKAYNSNINVQKVWQRTRVNWILENVSQNCKTILDAGCGSGVISLKLSENKKEVYACDISENAINFLNKKIKEKNIKNIKTKLQNLNDKLNYKENMFDCVISGEVLEHLENPSKFLKEIKRILKNNGKLIITTPNYFSLWPIIEYLWSKIGMRNVLHQHVSKFNVTKIKRVLEEEGFKIEKLETLFIFMPFLVMLSEKFYNIGIKIDKLISKLLNIGMIITVKARIIK